MGADVNILSNLFLPFGNVRMGYPTGEAKWGLMTIFKVVTTIELELSLNFISFVVYPRFIARCLLRVGDICRHHLLTDVVTVESSLSKGRGIRQRISRKARKRHRVFILVFV